MTTPAPQVIDPVAAHVPIRISTTQPAEPVELVTLFSIDDREYKIPARPRANLALRHLGLVRELGADMANVGLLHELLGAEAFDALAGCEVMTQDQLADIGNAVMRLTMGPLEGVSGN